MAACTAPEVAAAVSLEADLLVTTLGTITQYIEEHYPNDPSAGVAAIYKMIEELNTAFSHMQTALTTIAEQT